MNGLIGIKVGMTRFFTQEGSAVPVTVIKIEPHRITQVKTLKKDGYCAIQITTGIRKKLSRITKSELGHYAKSGVDVGRGLWEFRPNCDSDEAIESFYIGQVITVSLFNTVRKVDVTGISKGKGFSGTVKRWNFSSQDATHGNSLSHRAPGSIGQNQTPGKVFKGKKMSGQLGNVQVTIQNLDIVSVDLDHNLLFVKGSIPGGISDTVRVKISKKFLGVSLKEL